MPKSTYLFHGFSAFYFSAVVEPEDQDSVVSDGDPVNCCQPKAVIKLGNRLVPLCEISEKPFNCSSLCFLGFAFSGKLIIASLGLFVPLHIIVVMGFFRTITYLPHENPIFRTITYLAHKN